MKIVRLETADSTNNWAAGHEGEIESPTLIYCFSQTAGRGQRGNTWESEPGKNITASLLFHPRDFHASLQFRISEAIALALVDYLKDKNVEAKVKWPNDIYVGDKKICGILVEHVVTGKTISRTIAGFGLNLNQEKFFSNAPNPVSLIQITGEEYNLEKEVEMVSRYLEKRILNLSDPNLHSDFLKSLWRHDSRYHKFQDKLKDERIMARIHDVANDGILTLITNEGEKRKFSFKEIEFILN